MAKERTIRKKKASRAGKSQHDTEILRARRAVSAALGDESSAALLAQSSQKLPGNVAEGSSRKPANPSSPSGIPGVMNGLVRAVAGLVGHGSRPVVDEQPLPVYSALSASADPIAELDRRHISQSSESPTGSEDPTSRLCRQVLANMAQVHLDNLPQTPSKTTRI